MTNTAIKSKDLWTTVHTYIGSDCGYEISVIHPDGRSASKIQLSPEAILDFFENRIIIDEDGDDITDEILNDMECKIQVFCRDVYEKDYNNSVGKTDVVYLCIDDLYH